MRKAHNSKLKIQNSKLPKAIIQNSKFKTQNSKLTLWITAKNCFPLSTTMAT